MSDIPGIPSMDLAAAAAASPFAAVRLGAAVDAGVFGLQAAMLSANMLETKEVPAQRKPAVLVGMTRFIAYLLLSSVGGSVVARYRRRPKHAHGWIDLTPNRRVADIEQLAFSGSDH
jgi:hypothetical protein